MLNRAFVWASNKSNCCYIYYLIHILLDSYIILYDMQCIPLYERALDLSIYFDAIIRVQMHESSEYAKRPVNWHQQQSASNNSNYSQDSNRIGWKTFVALRLGCVVHTAMYQVLFAQHVGCVILIIFKFLHRQLTSNWLLHKAAIIVFHYCLDINYKLNQNQRPPSFSLIFHVFNLPINWNKSNSDQSSIRRIKSFHLH